MMEENHFIAMYPGRYVWPHYSLFFLSYTNEKRKDSCISFKPEACNVKHGKDVIDKINVCREEG
jgi:hypothetical protein